MMEITLFVVKDAFGRFLTSSGRETDELWRAYKVGEKEQALETRDFWQAHENKAREAMREKGRKDESAQSVKYTVWKVTATISQIEEDEK